MSLGTKQEVLGVYVSLDSFNKISDKLKKHLSEKKNPLLFVATPNPEQIVLAQKIQSFRECLNKADISIPDGVGLVWAIKFLLDVSVERIAGIDLAEKLVVESLKSENKVLLLGSSLDETQLQNLKSNILPSSISNRQSAIIYSPGSSNISKESENDQKSVLDLIRKERPSLLLVAYGAPWQELWIDSNREDLEKAGVKVAMVVGGSFDVWAGKVKRAPSFMRSLGLEWFWRLCLQPWRIKRQLRLLEFIFLVVKSKYF